MSTERLLGTRHILVHRDAQDLVENKKDKGVSFLAAEYSLREWGDLKVISLINYYLV